MGREPDARDDSAATRPHLSGDVGWAEIKNVPVLRTVVTVKHTGRTRTEFKNAGPAALTWKAGFPGAWNSITADGKGQKAEQARDESGAVYSFIRQKVEPGRTVIAETGSAVK